MGMTHLEASLWLCLIHRDNDHLRSGSGLHLRHALGITGGSNNSVTVSFRIPLHHSEAKAAIRSQSRFRWRLLSVADSPSITSGDQYCCHFCSAYVDGVGATRSSAAESCLRDRSSESACGAFGPIIQPDFPNYGSQAPGGSPGSELVVRRHCPIYWDPLTVPELFNATPTNTVHAQWRLYPKIVL
jgi:hypothetical protein